MAAAAALALGGCVAPTLPVPPPAQPEVSEPDANGIVTLKGGPGSATANAEVTVWNPMLDSGRGEGRTTVARSDGSWQEQIPAVSKQVLWVWQTAGFERSQHIEVKVP